MAYGVVGKYATEDTMIDPNETPTPAPAPAEDPVYGDPNDAGWDEAAEGL